MTSGGKLLARQVCAGQVPVVANIRIAAVRSKSIAVLYRIAKSRTANINPTTKVYVRHFKVGCVWSIGWCTY